MRASIAVLALVAVAASRGHCGGTPPYDPCEGKTCGETCRICPPDDAQCVETAVIKACDPLGRCVTWVADLCGPAADDCTGKPCGAPCAYPCPPGAPCPLPPEGGLVCDGAGRCAPLVPDLCPPAPPADPCSGKACGEACEPCGGMCMHPYASACDLWGLCVPASSWICWDPCAGKACGADCHLCPSDAVDCAETLELKACDPSGRCVSRTPEPVCPG